MTVGILALHGDVDEHESVLHLLKAKTLEVRTPEDLERVDHLILPGGESTVIAKLLESTGLRKILINRIREGTLPVFGTCAGAILLARRAYGPNPPDTLNVLDIDIDRNAYGSQSQSFEASIRVKGTSSPVRCAFIRAPRITRVGDEVEVLASHGGFPVLVKQGQILASTFHAELRGRTEVHRIFLSM